MASDDLSSRVSAVPVDAVRPDDGLEIRRDAEAAALLGGAGAGQIGGEGGEGRTEALRRLQERDPLVEVIEVGRELRRRAGRGGHQTTFPLAEPTSGPRSASLASSSLMLPSRLENSAA